MKNHALASQIWFALREKFLFDSSIFIFFDKFQSIDVEDLDDSHLADVYKNQNLFSHRPGPVYTIPEDESEDDGAKSDPDSRLIGEKISLCWKEFDNSSAREKKRKAARNVANTLIGFYDRNVIPATTTTAAAKTTTASATATTTYAIISLSGLQGEYFIIFLLHFWKIWERFSHSGFLEFMAVLAYSFRN